MFGPTDHRSCHLQPLSSLGPRGAAFPFRHRSVWSKRQQALSCRARRGSVIRAAAAPTHKLIIQGLHMPVTDNLKAYAEEKVNRACSHFEGGIKEVDVRMSVAGGDRGTGAKQQKTEITVYTLSNGVVRAEDVEESMYASIDLVSDRLARKLRKMKEKAIAHGSWHSSGRPLSAKPLRREVDPSTDDEEIFPTKSDDLSDAGAPEIVRTKYFMLDPMTPAEAVDLVEQLGHPFFLFRDKQTNEVQVIYKRQSHGYGLIIPSNEA